MNDEATPVAPQDGQPPAPRWEAPPARPQSDPPATQPPVWTAPQQRSGPPAPPWESQQPRSGPPALPKESQQRSGPPSPPWESQQRSGPPAPPWESQQQRSGPPAPPWESQQERSGPPFTPADANQATDANQADQAEKANQATPTVTTTAVPAPIPPQFNSGKPARQRNPLTMLIAGVVVALLAGGLGGYFIGAAGAGEEPTPSPSTVAPTAVAGVLPPFEARHMELNKGKLDGELAVAAEPWLAELDNCVSNLDKGAPPLPGDESRHVTCRLGPAWVHFIVYKAQAQKNAARGYRQQLNFNADAIAPGVRDPSRTTGGVTKAPGKLIEYAFPHQDGRVWCGLFWERDENPLTSVLIETFCESDLGGDWAVLRDLWQRHS